MRLDVLIKEKVCRVDWLEVALNYSLFIGINRVTRAYFTKDARSNKESSDLYRQLMT